MYVSTFKTALLVSGGPPGPWPLALYIVNTVRHWPFIMRKSRPGDYRGNNVHW